jgi:hypothetical protein
LRIDEKTVRTRILRLWIGCVKGYSDWRWAVPRANRDNVELLSCVLSRSGQLVRPPLVPWDVGLREATRIVQAVAEKFENRPLGPAIFSRIMAFQRLMSSPRPFCHYEGRHE